MKFGWKILLLCMSVYIIALTLSSILITENTYSVLLINEVKNFLDDEAKIYSYLPTSIPFIMDWELLDQVNKAEHYSNEIADIIKTNLNDSDKIYINIYSEDLRLLFSNFINKDYGQGEELVIASQGNRNYVLRWIYGRHYMIITDVLYVTDEMRIDKQKLIISLIKDITSVDEQRRTQYLSFIKTGALGFLVVVFITPIMSRFVMRSIQRLTEGVQDFSSGNYQFRFKVKGRDEIGILAHQFNIMAEEIEKRVKELEREGKKKQRFIDNLTHELRTPLTSILGYADLLKAIKYNEVVFHKSLEYIHSEGKRMLRLINSLMEMTLLGRTDIRIEEVNTDVLFEEVIDIMKIKSDKKDTHLYIRGRNLKILVNRDLLKEVLINLVDNAINASSPGSDIFLGTKVASDEVQLYVQDEGKGIPEDEIQKILEPFYRVDKSRSRLEGGVGLGLAICCEVIKMHGAVLEIESEVNKGTTVSIIFPHEAPTARVGGILDG